jgi:tetratricopeptide (TPR) repeat protein
MRYYKTLQLEKAYAEYKCCEEAEPDDKNAQYRLGIVSYALGRNDEAERCFTRCVKAFASEPEMLVASHYWLALAEARTKSGDALWMTFDFSLEIGHHTGYRDGLALLCGKSDADKIYRDLLSGGDALNSSIALYALVIYFRKLGDAKRAEDLYQELMLLDEYWAGLVYIAAYAERRL